MQRETIVDYIMSLVTTVFRNIRKNLIFKTICEFLSPPIEIY